MKKNGHKRSWVGVLALLVFIPLFCVSSYMVISQLYVDHQQSEAFDSLIEQVNQARNNPDMQVPSTERTTPVADAQSENGLEPAQIEEEAEATTKAIAQSASAVTPEPAATASVTKSSEAQGENPAAEPTDTIAAGVAMGVSAQSENAPATEPAAAGETAEPPAATVAEVMTPVPTATVVPTETPVPPMLSAYEPLYKKNKDIFGWIEIEDTVVNYPVMHTPNKPEYYLHRGFDRKEVYSGVPFMAGECFFGCGNYLIYGHHIKNGTQFAGITQYSSEEFWEEHPTIRFDTLYEVGVYDVVAAFYSKVYPNDVTDVFRYYQYTDLREEEAFTEYVSQVMDAAIYETGIELQYGDQLITLSTCEYSQTDGRFVVVGRKRE